MVSISSEPNILQAHCQSFVEELAKPTKEKKNLKNAQPHDKKIMNNTATNRLTNHGRQGSTGGSRLLAQWLETKLIEHSISHQHLWCIDSFMLQIPPLRQNVMCN